jgi:hypothetical protein
MKGMNMSAEWRTLQLFLDNDGVCEVEADYEDYEIMKCSCGAFAISRKCKHLRYVRREIVRNGGKYSIKISADIDDEDIVDAMKTAASFREFVLRYAKIEVLD